MVENLEFVGGEFGLRGTLLDERIAELLAVADLSEARNRVARQLSGGMRRKLGFCLAAIHDPPLLVLDEPSTGVDPVSRVDLWRLISSAAARGTAVLMTTTYLDEAERATQLLVLDGGRAIIECPPDRSADFLGGIVTATAKPDRPEWAWRRGRVYHEFWPEGNAAPSDDPITPDLEDIVIARSLVSRRRREVA